jgi:rRNA maturation protein Nop10
MLHRRAVIPVQSAIAIGLASTSVLLAAFTQPTPFESNGKWGYRDSRGVVTISPRFAVATDFSPEGIAAVVDEKGWAIIDARGKLLLRPFEFDNGPDPFQENLARYVEAGKVGFFNRRARVVIPPRFDFAAPFSEGRAAYCAGCKEVRQGEHRVRTGGKWGFLDPTGKTAIPARYDEVEPFQNGRARVRVGGSWQSVGKDGALVKDEPIGIATMERDGTIVLQLRAEGPGGERGDALFRYQKGHPRYDEVLRHLGGLKKGESKPVPTWPEK